MNILLFCSPHYYYVDNLKPLAKSFSIDHNVFFSSINIEKTEKVHVNNIGRELSIYDFLNKKVNFDFVILTQSWWLLDKVVANFCKNNNIPFYIVEHAPQMLWYKNVPYRSSLNGARAHFMWGKNSAKIMRKCGCKSDLPIVGAPRLEPLLHSEKNNYNSSERFAIYTTSQAMMPDNFLKKFILIQKYCENNNIKLFLKNHVKFDINTIKRYLNKDITRVYKNINTKKDIEFISSLNKLFFCFPSSVMIPSLYLKKDCYSLYGDHKNKYIANYSNKYKSILPVVNYNLKDAFNAKKDSKARDNWINNNLLYKESSFELIKKHIYGDI